MPKDFIRFMHATIIAMLLVSVTNNVGCSSRVLEQNQKNVLEQPQGKAPEQSQETVIAAKPEETSIFTVIELEDLEYPTLAASIRLPFRAGPNNSVVLAREHAYFTTERHLHVIDVSIPQRPSYLTTFEFPNKIGKVLASGDYLVVASRKTFHLVDISQPLIPVLQSTMYLPQRDAIKDFDVRDAHLYIIGANNSLSIFSLYRGQARLVKSVELKKRWWLLSLNAVRPDVKQVSLSTTSTFPVVLTGPLVSQRGFLQISSSREEKVRASSDFLVLESLRDPACDLLTFDAHRTSDHGRSSGMGHHNIGKQCHDHLSATGDKTLTRGKPTIAYIVDVGKMEQIAQDMSSETIDINDKRLVGPVTDFQISEDLLCVVHAKGFFSIKRLIKIEDRRNGENYRHDQFLSAIPLQASRPMSLAVGKGFACVLATPKDLH